MFDSFGNQNGLVYRQIPQAPHFRGKLCGVNGFVPPFPRKRLWLKPKRDIETP